MTLVARASRCFLAAAFVAAGIGAVAARAGAEDEPAGGRQAEIERAIGAAVRFLASQVGDDGKVAGEYPQSDKRCLFGGKTALCLYALLSAGEAPKPDAAAGRALEWIVNAKLQGVYPVAMRACAMSALKGAAGRERLAGDVRWLVEAADSNGAYTYTHQGGRRGDTYDNSSSQIALAGVWAGVSKGIEVPADYWRKVQQHWLDQQQIDGGWGYRIAPQAVRTRTYGSMTAAGLASLYACFDILHADQYVRTTGPSEYKPIGKALEWLADNFQSDENPRHGVEWYYYWLYCVQRVGMASGYKYFGSYDWYSSGAAELLRLRHDDGSWGVGDAGDRVAPTAFALLFLAGGRHPVLFNKLQYAGNWNSRPRDLANLTRWLTYTFEKPVGWQVVGLNSSLEDWHDAPILYISGAGACELSDTQVQKLRQFVLEGGMILSEAAGNSGAFSLDAAKIYERLFPRWPLKRLADKHPIYSTQFPTTEPTGLSGVHNGIRLLAVHSPRELSLALQLGPKKEHVPTFQLLANIHLLAAGREALRPRGTSLWPKARDFRPAATIRVARIEHAGNCDPEPLAWQRLAIIMGNRRGIRLDVSEPMPAAKLDAKDWPLAAMTGTEAFTLSSAEAAALMKYLSDGGTLIADAAGAVPEFAESFRKQVVPLVPGGVAELLEEDHPIYKGVVDGRVLYRDEFAQALGPGATKGRLRGVSDGKRVAIIYSPDDLTAGLVGYAGYRLRGYTPRTAVDLMINILTCAAGVKTPPS